MLRTSDNFGPICVTIIAAFFCLLFAWGALRIGASAASSTYHSQKEEVSEEIYQTFYEKSYNAAEKTHHVSNEISISIGSLREESRLEVLKVSNVAYEIRDSESENILYSIVDHIRDRDVSSWMKVPGNGVFTVNLQTAEFIIDDDRQYVLIRLPKPELTEFTIDYSNVEELYFDDKGAFKNSAMVGVELAREQLESAELDLRAEITSNQRFYQSACDAAENILTNLVRELNPEMPELTVDIEFME